MTERLQPFGIVPSSSDYQSTLWQINVVTRNDCINKSTWIRLSCWQCTINTAPLLTWWRKNRFSDGGYAYFLDKDVCSDRRYILLRLGLSPETSPERAKVNTTQMHLSQLGRIILQNNIKLHVRPRPCWYQGRMRFINMALLECGISGQLYTYTLLIHDADNLVEQSHSMAETKC